jgi:RNA polymerase sigma factor (sigma-70 family)
MSSLLEQNLPSDERLTAAVAAGDEAAFEELFRRYTGPLGAYGGRILRDTSRGEDVAQTALMRAYDALRRGAQPLRVKPWLYKIALNTALELKAKHGEVSDGEPVEMEDTSPDVRAARRALVAGVQQLPPRQRDVFVLREIKGLPVAEVASRLSLTNQQVEQALFAARNRLAELLVFGDRLDCASVAELDVSQLTRHERRAVKSHVRSCPACRRNGLGLSSLGFWLRDAWAWLVGGGASAAKLGAVAATATVLGGAPLVAPKVADRVLHRDSAPAKHVAAAGAAPAKWTKGTKSRAHVLPAASHPIVRAATLIAPEPAEELTVAAEENVPAEEPVLPEPAALREEESVSPPAPEPEPAPVPVEPAPEPRPVPVEEPAPVEEAPAEELPPAAEVPAGEASVDEPVADEPTPLETAVANDNASTKPNDRNFSAP